MMTKLISRLRHFRADRRGAVAIMTALAMVPILLSLGGAIDYARIMALRTRLQQATDSAALAALAAAQSAKINPNYITNAGGAEYGSGEVSTLGSSGAYKDVASNYIEQNFNPDKSFQITTNATPDWQNGTLTLNVSTPAQTYLLALAGIDKINISASATAAIGEGGKMQEIAIAFDTTFSMNFKGRKEAALAAAKDFIKKVMNYSTGLPNPNVKVALVPFNDYVNVGNKYFWRALPIGVSWLTSTDDIVQKFPKVCWDAKTETKEIEKCSNVSTTCQRPKCTTVSKTCTKDGENYACTGTECSGTEDYACDKEVCVGTGTLQTTTTPGGCNAAYEIVTPWKGCVGSRDSTSDVIDRADENNKVPAVFSVACPNVPIAYLSANYLITYLNQGKTVYTYYRNAEANLYNQLDNIVFDGSTYIAPGLLWAWRVLSPEKPVAGWYESSTEWMPKSDYDKYIKDGYTVTRCGLPLSPESLLNKLKTWGLPDYNFWNYNAPGCPYDYVNKSIILMTDGYSTKSASYDALGLHEKTDRAAANAKLAKICTNIKSKGIKIYTIAFTVNDSDTLNTLKDCASDSKSYFDAVDAAALAGAFQNIGNNQTRLRLIK